MSLFGRLLARRRARWDEDWRTFPGTTGDAAGLWVVDLGAVGAAPVAGLPVRLDAQWPYPPAAEGLPADLGVLEPAITAMRAGAAGLGGVYVGLVASRGWCRLTAHLPSRPDPGPPEPVTSLPQAQVSSEYDPHWAYVRDRLAPDERQHQLLVDLSMVELLARSGDPLTTPRPVTHVAVFTEPGAAELTAAELRGAGYRVEVTRDDEGDYSLDAEREDPVAAPAVHDLSWSVKEAVERHGGAYGGWSCPYVA
jgi:regulator of ribonuclease activity B